jgi:hypothetical protein
MTTITPMRPSMPQFGRKLGKLVDVATVNKALSGVPVVQIETGKNGHKITIGGLVKTLARNKGVDENTLGDIYNALRSLGHFKRIRTLHYFIHHITHRACH